MLEAMCYRIKTLYQPGHVTSMYICFHIYYGPALGLATQEASTMTATYARTTDF